MAAKFRARPDNAPKWAKNGPTSGQGKVEKVMGEFSRGTLRSGSGARVKNRKQAIAIAMSEAGKSRRKKK